MRREEVKPEDMFTSKERRDFYKLHGEYVVTKDREVLFADGAIEEAGDYGRRLPPPTAAFERAKLVCLYWEIKARRTVDEFDQFKGYMLGNGVCPAHVRTEKQKFDHLEHLKVAATSAAKRLREVTKELEDETPAWMVAREREQIDEARRKQLRREKVQSIRL